MQQRAQDIIVLTRSAWQTPTGRDLPSSWSPSRDDTQISPTPAWHPPPRQTGSTAHPLHA